MRLFVAIELSDILKEELARLFAPIPRLRLTPPEQLHLTLRFLGEQPESRLAALIEALKQVRFSPFALRFAGSGVFPDWRRPQVFWLGLAAEPALIDLRRAVEQMVTEAGAAAEAREFVPHLTLARFKTPPRGALIDELAAREDKLPAASWAVDRFVLFSSELTPNGAIHRSEAVFAAVGPGA